jgi:hypothetical protein
MNNTVEIDADEAKIVRITSRLPQFRGLETADLAEIRHEITHTVSKIPCEYLAENTHKTKLMG